jgi:hypothetical protein
LELKATYRLAPQMLAKKPPSPQQIPASDCEFSSGLSSLPYDLLLNIATFLDLRDVHALHLVSNPSCSFVPFIGISPEGFKDST